jgi:hypothetical protein
MDGGEIKSLYFTHVCKKMMAKNGWRKRKLIKNNTGKGFSLLRT